MAYPGQFGSYNPNAMMQQNPSQQMMQDFASWYQQNRMHYPGANVPQQMGMGIQQMASGGVNDGTPPANAQGISAQFASNKEEAVGTRIAMNTTNVFLNAPADEIYITNIDSTTQAKNISVYKRVLEGAVVPEEASPLQPAVDLSSLEERLDRIEELLTPKVSSARTSTEVKTK